MSPARRRHIALFSALGTLSLTFYYWPLLLYIITLLAFIIIALYFHCPESLPARLGLSPRAGVNIQAVLRRWLRAWGVEAAAGERPGRFGSGKSKLSAREAALNSGQRLPHSGPYRHTQEARGSDSLLFSPRDLLMGSYITKADSPPAAAHSLLRARAPPLNPRDELRDRLARPNPAVYTPNRRLSFSGEALGTGARFSITPQRHYPLHQQGASPVGVLPPLRWDGFRQKSVLSPRNSSVCSPVTVKIARPDTHSLEHVCSPVLLPSAETDPCSRESVLKVLKESRKREVEEERSLETQRSKRRRNDSGGSAQSAFEPLLPNGTSAQLIPKPGSLKRGLTVAVEEQSLKRSRTSSVSSSSGGALGGLRGAALRAATASSRRNPISSSYSSTQGLNQRKRPLAAASPRSSPGPSRSHTPEVCAKKTREEEQSSPSPVPCEPSDTALSSRPELEESTSPKEASVSSTERTQSGGKPRRKIQLVSREETLSLPPAPELGYSITVQDLDEEKRSALDKIHKLLETPAPEPPPSVPSTSGPSLSSSVGPLSDGLSFTASSTSSTAAPISTSASSTSAGTVGEALAVSVGVSFSTAGGSTRPLSLSAAPETSLLLEVLKRKSPSPAPAAAPSSTAQVQPSLTLSTSVPPASSTSTVAPPSASSTPAPGPSLFSLPLTSAASSTPSSIPSSTPAASSSASLLSSGFKPIFNVSSPSTTTTTAADTKPPPTFKPLFEAAPGGSTAASTTSTASVFGGGSATSLFPSSTSAPVSSSNSGVFGGSSSSGTTLQFSSGGAGITFGQTAPTQSTSSTASFGGFGTTSTTAAPSAVTFGTTSSSQSTPSFGSTFGTTTSQSTPGFGAVTTAQSGLSFGTSTSSQSAPTFGTTSTTFGTATPSQPQSTFGTTTSQSLLSFGASTTSSQPGGTTTAPSALTFGTTAPSQSTFTFGKPSESAQSQPSFSATAEPPKPFTFGAPSSAPTPQTVASAPTTVPSFGTLAKPSFSFGSSAPAAAPSSSSSGTFTFGSAASQPPPPSNTPQPSTPFKFGAAPSTQFGTPGNNSAPQMGTFTFGATDKPSFGSPAPVFGQTSTPAPIPFGSPGTPAASFNAPPFGSPATPSFSIGAGSKPSATRQRLQARRQHTRKK